MLQITLKDHYQSLLTLQRWYNYKIRFRNWRGDKEKYKVTKNGTLILNPNYEPNRKIFPLKEYTTLRELRKRVASMGNFVSDSKSYMVGPRSTDLYSSFTSN